MVGYLPHNVAATMRAKKAGQKSDSQGEDIALKVIKNAPTLRKVNSQFLNVKNENSSNESNSNLGRYDEEKSENCRSDQSEHYAVDEKLSRTYDDIDRMRPARRSDDLPKAGSPLSSQNATQCRLSHGLSSELSRQINGSPQNIFSKSTSDRKLSDENELKLMEDEDEDTPHFSVEHKSTACFGNEEEFRTYLGGGADGTPLETDGGHLLVHRRRELTEKQVLRQTIVKKRYGLKQLLSSKRQLFLYRDGFIAYTEKNNQAQIKQAIDPHEILQIMRSKSTVTLVAEVSTSNLGQGGDRDTVLINNTAKQQAGINYSFKFSTIEEAKEWYKLISNFI